MLHYFGLADYACRVLVEVKCLKSRGCHSIVLSSLSLSIPHIFLHMWGLKRGTYSKSAYVICGTTTVLILTVEEWLLCKIAASFYRRAEYEYE